MTAKTLTEAFEVKNKTFSPKDDVVDYDIFANKNLLEELRTKIIESGKFTKADLEECNSLAQLIDFCYLYI